MSPSASLVVLGKVAASHVVAAESRRPSDVERAMQRSEVKPGTQWRLPDASAKVTQDVIDDSSFYATSSRRSSSETAGDLHHAPRG